MASEGAGLGRHDLSPHGSSAILLPLTPHAPGLARRTIEERLADALAPDVLYDAELLVSELVTNSLQHAHLHRGDSIELGIRVDPEEHVARIEVSNRGSGFEQQLVPAAPSAVGGRGLQLVDQIASSCGVSQDPGTVVWSELNTHNHRQKRGPPSPPSF